MGELERRLRDLNRGMIAFDLALASGALLRPDATLAILGHSRPSPDARELFRRCAPIWFTFAAAHAVAATRGERRDWWALAWLRGTEIATDALWARIASVASGRSRAPDASARSNAIIPRFRSRSPRPGARAALWGAGAANLAMALGFGRLARGR
jgi:hypothetical protein